MRGRLKEYISGVMPGHLALLLPFGIYVLTMAPTVTFWDSGELASAAMDLGVAHHPGYPLYLNIAKAFTFIPLGNVAFRLALMSSVCASSAAYVLFRLLRALGGGGASVSWAASAAAALFALSPMMWPQAVVVEVYGLHALMLCLIGYAALRYLESGRMAYFALTCFLFGLSMGNHHTTLFLVPAGIVMLAADRGIRNRPVRVLHGAAFGLFGYGVNLYLPVRALADAFMNIGNPRNLGHFIWLMRWKEYGRAVEKKLLHPFETFSVIGGGLWGVLAGLAAVAILAAIIYSARRRLIVAMAAITAASFIGGIALVMQGDSIMAALGLHTKFYFPASIFGLAMVFAWLGDRDIADKSKETVIYVAVAAVISAFVILVVYNGYERNRHTENYYADDFGRNTLKSVPQDGMLFAWGDNGVFPAWYLQAVERYREDVLYVYTPIMMDDWYYNRIRRDATKRYGASPPRYKWQRYIDRNIEGFRAPLVGRAYMCYDYTTMDKFGYGPPAFTPRGMVWVPGRNLSIGNAEIWAAMTIRVDDPKKVSKELVAEGIFQIYGYQAFWWGERARLEGRPKEAKDAYYKALFYGYEPALVEMRLGGQ